MLQSQIRQLTETVNSGRKELEEDTERYYALCENVEGIPNDAIGLDSKKVQETKKAAKYLEWCLGEQKDSYEQFDETVEKNKESSDLYSNYENLLDSAQEVPTAWKLVDGAVIRLRQLIVECGITPRPQQY